MDVIDSSAERSHISVTREELLIVNNALNEVCNGIEVFEFETRIGESPERVAALLNEIGALLDRMHAPGESPHSGTA
jgi:hypothetical protein